MKHVAPIIPAIAVDEYASLLAQIAPLQERADQLKAQLKALGVETVHGTLHDATIKLSERNTPDTEKLRTHFGLLGKSHDEAWQKAWCKKTLVTSLSLTGR